jgi:hypothetical protein
MSYGYPHGDPRCGRKGCNVIPDDPDYACYGVENCPEGWFEEDDDFDPDDWTQDMTEMLGTDGIAW